MESVQSFKQNWEERRGLISTVLERSTLRWEMTCLRIHYSSPATIGLCINSRSAEFLINPPNHQHSVHHGRASSIQLGVRRTFHFSTMRKTGENNDVESASKGRQNFLIAFVSKQDIRRHRFWCNLMYLCQPRTEQIKEGWWRGGGRGGGRIEGGWGRQR